MVLDAPVDGRGAADPEARDESLVAAGPPAVLAEDLPLDLDLGSRTGVDDLEGLGAAVDPGRARVLAGNGVEQDRGDPAVIPTVVAAVLVTHLHGDGLHGTGGRRRGGHQQGAQADDSGHDGEQYTTHITAPFSST